MNNILPFIFLAIGVLLVSVFVSKRTAKVTLNVAFLKAAASVCFIATGVFAMAVNPDCPKLVGAFVAIGGVWGLLGDIALDLKYVFKKYENEYLTAGFSSFGIGHFFYLFALVLSFKSNGKAFVFAIIGAVLAAAFVFITEPLFKVKYGKFKLITLCYTSFLGLVLGLSIGYAVYDYCLASLLVAIGFSLFLGSDAFLSGLYFGQTEKDRTNRVAIILNHIFYYSAQFVLAISLYYI